MGLSMSSSNCANISKQLLLFMFHFLVMANSLHSLQQPSSSCHDEESFALLQFKKSFVIDEFASVDEGAYPKVLSWKPAAAKGCCSWDGVKCDQRTDHVIGLDLSSSFLSGSINSNSTLFHLVYLQSLNLADNDFNQSQIPTTIRNFPMLRYLNLSSSFFSGQIPSEISHLPKLLSLDLSSNSYRSNGERSLKLNQSDLRRLVQNLTSLKKLHLSSVIISAPIPDSLVNLSFLTSLLLEYCELQGEFPVILFKLQSLKFLNIESNPDLTGFLPAFEQTSPLMSLRVSRTRFSGYFPFSIEKLDSLNEFVASRCNFSGLLPSSLGNLRRLVYLDLSNNTLTGSIPASLATLTQLSYLSLDNNNFSGYIPSSLGNLTQLTTILLASNQLTGPIPSSLGNLTQLTELDLSGNDFGGYIPSSIGDLNQLITLSLSLNQLTGPIPSSLGNLSKLTSLDISSNNLHSSIPESLSNLTNLMFLYLDNNSLSGKVNFQMFQKFQNLVVLYLSGNKLELLFEGTRFLNATATFPNLMTLGLGSCNITEFPSFLRYQENLRWLDLAENGMHGQVPRWMWNVSTESLTVMNISHNFLSGFDQPPVVLSWSGLQLLDLSSNMIQGSPLIPSPSIEYYLISNNKLSGKLSPLICNLTSLNYLDLSDNKLSGMLPPCLGNFSDNLRVLDLGNNSFEGHLPQTYTRNLTMFDASDNKLQGRLPRSLANCVMLEFLVLSNNEFNDVFPFWLGTLPELKLLALRHNAFHGVIRKPEKNLDHFLQLRILDLSFNNFSGNFPFEYIFSGNAIKGTTSNQFSYMKTTSDVLFNPSYGGKYFSFTITSKDVNLFYSKIPEDFAAIDISSNRFEGKVPEFIGALTGLRLLNMSNNILTGLIPSSLGKLKLLESLDLSQNKLSGEIPRQLTQISFLAKFDVSHNNLSGPIPRGTQFATFESTSYEGNLGLCGDPLPKKCGNEAPHQLPPSTKEENSSDFGNELDWIFVLAGSVSGLLVGVVLADVLFTRKHEYFLKIVGILIRLMKRKSEKRTRRN
ncbi:putative leucine-rich repeat-containing, plant-type, leucine-rich repeat domain, L [Rosa chinensis]|uniref:Putative leucine-rich repeat-containing, plant-type, leucine-rich repeat domain, L n=1 Tax=Rosa chinensis TaxID=74649 RepID=A0A2P6PME7_ROSCH|nr:receptor-like protein 6 [Rosa chinensis]PRQ23104.1 putative leucine-rich repeat-containing, plant-type, leucine-rich repeat domain, L [Rosa chinensis]